jgi:hypothetical protein
MAPAAIHIQPDDNFDDWTVREEDGREHGHFPTREAAELVARPLARERQGVLVVHLPDGRTSRKSFVRGRIARLLARWLKH